MELRYRMDKRDGSRTGMYAPTDTALLLPFYPTGYGEFVSGPQYFTQRRGLESWLFFATVSGCGILQSGGREKLLNAGRMAVIDCSQEQYYATSGDGPWRFFWMHFSGCAADSFVRMINGGGLRIADGDPARAAELYDQLDSMVRTPGRQTDLLISLWIHQLLCELARAVDCGPISRHQAAVESAVSFLREHLEEPIRVGDLARKAGMSEFYFQRVFREVMGQSPYEYLTRLRIQRAKLLLLSSDKSIAEIAAAVGYSDARGLINSFKKREGCTPSCLRKRKASERILP